MSYAATRPLRWKPWAVAGAIVVLLIVVVALRGGDERAPSSLPTSPALAVPQPPPQELPFDGLPAVAYPKNLSGKSARDWEKVVRKVYEERYDKALDELDKWEDKYGPREESQRLRTQLERLPTSADDD